MHRILQIGLIGLIILTTGCAGLMLNEDGTDFNRYGRIVDWFSFWHKSDAEITDVPEPIDPIAVPLAGEMIPDPRIVLYTFIFSDGTELRFRDNHAGDYWGDYPSAGWGQITNPDGSTRGVDINTIVRHGSKGQSTTPITTATHGKRYFWMADREEQKDVKRVDIFEDGWQPGVESAVLITQNDLGIGSWLIACETVLEK